jgi:hypothetical protein
MQQLFLQKKFDQCELCAYHESGHILFAYLCGYSCKYVELINDKNENDFTSIAIIDYGEDSKPASSFIAPDANMGSFTSATLAGRMESVEVGQRIIRIFLGGSAAAAVFNNNGDAHIPLPMQIDFTDLLRVEFIQQVLQELSSDITEDFVEYSLQDALYTLSNINVWNTVVDLAKLLLQRNQLNKNDIEECLEAHGILYNDMSTTAGFETADTI